MNGEGEGALIAEKLKRTIDRLEMENQRLKAEKDSELQMVNLKLDALIVAKNDHEQRIRSLQDGVVSFKVWSGLTTGGAGFISIVALVRTFVFPGG